MAKREVAICTLDENTGAEVEIGRLRVKDGVLVADPPDTPLLEALLDEEVKLPGSDGGTETFRASKDPEAFLEALMKHYRSPYLRACRKERTTEHYDPTQPRDEGGKWTPAGGGPLLHGSSTKGLKELKPNERGVLFLTPDKHAAGFHAAIKGKQEVGDVYKVDVKIKNPRTVTTLEFDDVTANPKFIAETKKKGHDAIVSDDGKAIAVFEPVKVEVLPDSKKIAEEGWDKVMGPGGNPKKHQDGGPQHTLLREQTPLERKVDFARVEGSQDELQAEGKARLMEVLGRMRETLLGVVGKRLEAGELTTLWVRNLDLKFKGELQRVAREILGEGYRLGARESRRMLQEKRLQVRLVPGLPPEKALAFFEQKAFYITGVLKDRLLNGARNILYNGIKTGVPGTDVIRELKELFDEYLGDPTAIAPGKEEQAQPYRLETILRTNVNEAYNEGLKDGVDEEVESGFVIGFLYSAIIDGRQTEVCDFLDGKILRPDTEDTNALTPSNHFQCRSILIPVTKDEGPVTFITAAQIGRALELKQKGF